MTSKLNMKIRENYYKTLMKATNCSELMYYIVKIEAHQLPDTVERCSILQHIVKYITTMPGCLKTSDTLSS